MDFYEEVFENKHKPNIWSNKGWNVKNKLKGVSAFNCIKKLKKEMILFYLLDDLQIIPYCYGNISK